MIAFDAALLSGGWSRRMGRDKALLSYQGETLLERQVRILRQAGAARVLLSHRVDQSYMVPGTVSVPDRGADQGPIDGLLSCLIECRQPLLLVLAVDMPAMSAAFLQSLVAVSTVECGLAPAGKDGLEPLAAVYSRKLLPDLQNYVGAGHRSLHGFIKAMLERGGMRLRVLAFSEQEFFVNWNTPEDIPSVPQ